MAQQNKEILEYIDILYPKFKNVSKNVRGKSTLEAYHEKVIDSVSDLKFDTSGDFIRENINDAHMLFCSMLLYTTMVHIIISKKKSPHFMEIITSQYKLKRFVVMKHGAAYEEMFVYLKNLFTYGNRTFSKKVITPENLNKWQLAKIS